MRQPPSWSEVTTCTNDCQRRRAHLRPDPRSDRPTTTSPTTGMTETSLGRCRHATVPRKQRQQARTSGAPKTRLHQLLCSIPPLSSAQFCSDLGAASDLSHRCRNPTQGEISYCYSKRKHLLYCRPIVFHEWSEVGDGVEWTGWFHLVLGRGWAVIFVVVLFFF